MIRVTTISPMASSISSKLLSSMAWRSSKISSPVLRSCL
nr:MAG TPA: hypothetical protein [Caudoviricetes sp.]